MRVTLMTIALLLNSFSFAQATDEASCLTKQREITTHIIALPKDNKCQRVEAKAQSPIQVAGQGCCSYHGGECGCSFSGHVQCCDGNTSPSCGC